ncbi:MAG: SDR family oxidoreductase [Chloroflexi bacterium]|nr:SDR family oxidoreductase [Chloroflexota bacterium]
MNAFITGAGRGIGEAIAYAFAREKIRVICAARTQSDVERVASAIRARGGDARAVVCDVTQPDSIARALDQAGEISILVNNAGAAESHKFLNHDDAVWHRMLAINLTSVYQVTKAIAPMMIAAKWGRIINIASIASKVGARYVAAYTASKHGVLGLTRALAVELNSYNITVNAICPGYVDTPMTDHNIANIVARTGLTDNQVRESLAKTSPQNRLITADEVAHVARMLVGENARGITGQAINVDGGAVMF